MNLNQPVIEAIQTITVGNVLGMFIGWFLGMVIVIVALAMWSSWRDR
jgi:membrane protein YqaA with SNARE-associated domain